MTVSFADYLPACLSEDPFLRDFLRIFDDVANTVDSQVSGLEHLFDVSVAPDHMVRWLGSWLGIDDIDSSIPIERQRLWVEKMGTLLWWRGTRTGLRGVLGLSTGRAVDVVDTGGVYPRHAPVQARSRLETTAPAPVAPTRHNPRHVHVWVEDVGRTTDEHLLAVLRRELPAEVTFELQVGNRMVWPPRGEG